MTAAISTSLSFSLPLSNTISNPIAADSLSLKSMGIAAELKGLNAVGGKKRKITAAAACGSGKKGKTTKGKKPRWNETVIRSIIDANAGNKSSNHRWKHEEMTLLQELYNARTKEDRSHYAVTQKVKKILDETKTCSSNSTALKKVTYLTEIYSSESKKANDSLPHSSLPSDSIVMKKVVRCTRPQVSAHSIGLDLTVLKKMIKNHAFVIENDRRDKWRRRVIEAYNKATGGKLAFSVISPYINDLVWPVTSSDSSTVLSEVCEAPSAPIVGQIPEASSDVANVDPSEMVSLSESAACSKTLIKNEQIDVAEELGLGNFADQPFTPFV